MIPPCIPRPPCWHVGEWRRIGALLDSQWWDAVHNTEVLLHYCGGWWPPTRDGSQSSVSSLAKQSLRKRYSPILRCGYFAQLYLIFINSNSWRCTNKSWWKWKNEMKIKNQEQCVWQRVRSSMTRGGCGECEMPAYDQHHNREVGVAFYITSVTQNRSK